MDKITGLGIDTANIINRNTYTSSDFKLQKTNPLHMDDDDVIQKASAPTSFQELLLGSLDKASDVVNQSNELALQAIVDPESVDIHDITIAQQKATQVVRLTTSVINRALEAYRTIIALR